MTTAPVVSETPRLNFNMLGWCLFFFYLGASGLWPEKFSASYGMLVYYGMGLAFGYSWGLQHGAKP